MNKQDQGQSSQKKLKGIKEKLKENQLLSQRNESQKLEVRNEQIQKNKNLLESKNREKQNYASTGRLSILKKYSKSPIRQSQKNLKQTSSQNLLNYINPQQNQQKKIQRIKLEKQQENKDNIMKKSFKIIKIKEIQKYKIKAKQRDLDDKESPINAFTYNNEGFKFDQQANYQEENDQEVLSKINIKRRNNFYNEAICLNNQGHFQEAIKCYDSLIEMNPQDDQAYYCKGINLSSLGRYKEAIQCFDQAINLEPKNYEIYYSKGLCLFQQGLYQEAIECQDLSIQFNSQNDKAYLNKGQSLQEMSQYKKALDCYDAAIKLNNAEALLYKGFILQIQEKKSKSLEYHKKAFELRPDLVQNELLSYFKCDQSYQMFDLYLLFKKFNASFDERSKLRL